MELVPQLCNGCRLYKGVPFICLEPFLKWKFCLSFAKIISTEKMQLDSRFILLLLLTSPISLFAAPYLSDSLQTTIAQCEEIQCQPVSCDNPITLDGQCCPICVEPGKGLSLSLYVTLLYGKWFEYYRQQLI